MNASDLAGYRAVKRAPTRATFTDAQRETFEVFGMGMPSSGGATMALILNTVLLFARTHPWLWPSIRAVDSSASCELFRTGGFFFVCGVVFCNPKPHYIENGFFARHADHVLF